LSNFWLDFYVDHQPTGCGDWASVVYWQVSSLAPGATRDFTYNYTFNTAGTHNLWAFVDSGCDVPESNEGNNIRGPVAINVTGSQPDLVVDSISFSPSNPTVGQSVAFTIRIRNQGTGATSLTVMPNLERQERSSREGVNGDQALSNFWLDFYVDHQPAGCGDWASVAYWQVSSLAPGATRDFTYNYTFNTAGTHNLWAFVDSGCDVPESNEGNNIRGPVVINIQGGTGNLALGKPAYASSVERGDESQFGPRNATDGNLNTRWSSRQQYEGGQNFEWIWVDLQHWYNINRVTLRWETAYATIYEIQSWNGSRWVVNYRNNNGHGGVETINFSAINTCCVAMVGVSKVNSSWGYSLWELEVYGSGGAATGSEAPMGIPQGEMPKIVLPEGDRLLPAPVQGTETEP
jgi:hypothetical protein